MLARLSGDLSVVRGSTWKEEGAKSNRAQYWEKRIFLVGETEKESIQNNRREGKGWVDDDDPTLSARQKARGFGRTMISVMRLHVHNTFLKNSPREVGTDPIS